MRDALRSELSSRGVPFVSTQARDLEIRLPSGRRAVIEMKHRALHDSGFHAIYEALGQLYYHTRAIEPDVVLVVCGRAVAARDGVLAATYGDVAEGTLRSRLQSLGVHLILTDTDENGMPRWSGLDELLGL
jgi:hypothetical protein